MRASYSKKVSDYLNSHEFLEENQMIYLKRFKSISETALGENVELLNCYKRLAKVGLVSTTRISSSNGTMSGQGQEGREVQQPYEDGCHEYGAGLRGRSLGGSGLHTVLLDLPRELGIRPTRENNT